MEEEDVNPTVKVPRIKPALQSTPPATPQEPDVAPVVPAQTIAQDELSAGMNLALEPDPPATEIVSFGTNSQPQVVETPPWLRAASAAPHASPPESAAPEPPPAPAPRAAPQPTPVAAPSWLQYIGAVDSPAASPATSHSGWAEIVPSLPASAPADIPPTPRYAPEPVPQPPVAAPAPPPAPSWSAPAPRSFAFDGTTAPSMPAVAAPFAPAHSASEDEEEDMANTQWEYCRIQLDSGSYGQKQTIGRYPYFVRVTLDFYGADYVGTEVFGEDTDQIERPNKMWGQILGLLGMANWELINIFTGPHKDLALVNVMAYMKRPVQPGRRVNEPKIVL